MQGCSTAFPSLVAKRHFTYTHVLQRRVDPPLMEVTFVSALSIYESLGPPQHIAGTLQNSKRSVLRTCFPWSVSSLVAIKRVVQKCGIDSRSKSCMVSLCWKEEASSNVNELLAFVRSQCSGSLLVVR